ncbi:MAG: hypothetical protein EOP73_31795, partial [Variovorax sp.]
DVDAPRQLAPPARPARALVGICRRWRRAHARLCAEPSFRLARRRAERSASGPHLRRRPLARGPGSRSARSAPSAHHPAVRPSLRPSRNGQHRRSGRGAAGVTHPYATLDYALSLPHVGEPIEIAEWDSFVLARALPDGRGVDATGAYPVATISPEADLAAGLDRLAKAGLVSLVMVVETHLRPSLDRLDTAFDSVRPFKTHHVHDRRIGPPAYGKHHRYELRRALAKVEVCEIALADHLEAWIVLYDGLAARHALAGLHAFPRRHHETLARLPGVRTFAAFIDGVLASAHIFVAHHGHAMSHLAASSAQGYAAGEHAVDEGGESAHAGQTRQGLVMAAWK